MVIPRLAAAVKHLHHAHAAFHQAPRHEAAVGEIAAAVQLARGLGFMRQVKRFRRLRLHAESDLHRLDARLKLRVALAFLGVNGVQPVDQVQLLTLRNRTEVRVVDVFDDILGIQLANVAALIDARQKAVAPKLRADDRFAGTQHHEAWQVLVFRAEPVAQPRTHARAHRLRVTAGHHQQRRLVVGHVRVHAAEHGDVVNALGHFGENLAHLHARLTVPLKLKWRLEQTARAALRLEIGIGRTLAVILVERRLGIERIHLRRPAIHEQVNHPLGARRKMRRLRGQRTRWTGRLQVAALGQ